ncbi:hypothetical protein NEIRO03_1346 [Nematocida sp. AWRm78]|nr:hypothetical protein NEIRO03_1346 [Nematocida sp. AWRm78]
MRFNIEHFLFISIFVMVVFSISAVISDTTATPAPSAAPTVNNNTPSNQDENNSSQKK